jgi:RNA polymerase-binding transcription factor DksA
MTSTDPQLRYSEEDLKEFDGIISEKLINAKKELQYIRESLSRKNDQGTDLTGSGHLSLEDGAETAEKEHLNQMASRLQKFTTQLELAQIRIKNGTYGVCIQSGKLIPKERLRAVPHTQHTIEAKLGK